MVSNYSPFNLAAHKMIKRRKTDKKYTQKGRKKRKKT